MVRGPYSKVLSNQNFFTHQSTGLQINLTTGCGRVASRTRGTVRRRTFFPSTNGIYTASSLSRCKRRSGLGGGVEHDSLLLSLPSFDGASYGKGKSATPPTRRVARVREIVPGGCTD